MFPIKRTLKESDKQSDFVAIGNLINNEQVSFHSAFIIKYDSKLFVFHYTGREIDFNIVEDDYFHRITETIVPDEVPAFIAQCKNIQKNAKPKYGYFYSGESYLQNGNHIGNKYLGERMTCVGFCLNVLKGFLEEDYLQYSDWLSESHEVTDYLNDYCTRHNLNPEELKHSHRRITPRECLVSALFNDLPIRKDDIDNWKEPINNYITKMKNSD